MFSYTPRFWLASVMTAPTYESLRHTGADDDGFANLVDRHRREFSFSTRMVRQTVDAGFTSYTTLGGVGDQVLVELALRAALDISMCSRPRKPQRKPDERFAEGS
jgi:hypothetical protein